MTLRQKSSTKAVFYFWSTPIILVISTILVFLVFSTAEDEVLKQSRSWIYILSGAAIASLLLGLFFQAIFPWLIEEQKVTGTISEVLYSRSARLKRESFLVLVLAFLLVIGASIVYFKASWFASEDMKVLFKSETNLTVPPWSYIALFVLVRVGDIAIASFLTYILLSIYRYNVRLSAFYASRADAIILFDQPPFSKSKFEGLPLLLDANLDFGKNRETLVKSFADLISALHPAAAKDEKPSESKDGKPQG